MNGFEKVFEGKEGIFACKRLITSRLLKYSESSKNCVRHVFFERFLQNHILLIINTLYLNCFFRLFISCKKSVQVLNFHFGRKYHFVKNGKLIFVMFWAAFLSILPFLILGYTLQTLTPLIHYYIYVCIKKSDEL